MAISLMLWANSDSWISHAHNEKEAQVPESEILRMVISMCIDTQNKVALSENSFQTNRTFQIADLPYWVFQEVLY